MAAKQDLRIVGFIFPLYTVWQDLRLSSALNLLPNSCSDIAEDPRRNDKGWLISKLPPTGRSGFSRQGICLKSEKLQIGEQERCLNKCASRPFFPLCLICFFGKFQHFFLGFAVWVDQIRAAKPLNCEEEQLMRVFYEQKIQEVCGAFKFPHKIQGTAIIYFKRFYLQWSVMEHHPKHIMLTCIYASCKVEENHVSAEELGKGIQQDHQVILNNEMVVLQSLGFDLIVYAPYRSIEGFIEDIEEFVRARDVVKDNLKELREAANFEVDKAMLTDAPLLFSPGQLALSALRKSNEVLNVVDFERYLKRIVTRQSNSHNTSQLIESLNAIDFLVGKLAIPTAKDMRHIDRKLRGCLDPSSQDDGKKREKKPKHKSKRTSSEMQGAQIEG